MSDKNLDPHPVWWIDGPQRTAILSLPRTFPNLYVFEPRPAVRAVQEAMTNE